MLSISTFWTENYIAIERSHFAFEGYVCTVYEQTDGTAMGFPSLAHCCKPVLEHLEEEAIRSAPLHPKLWRRYMDDTFVIWSHGHLYLNSQHPSIQFTMEEEKDHKIAFLDVVVTRNSDKLATSVYKIFI